MPSEFRMPISNSLSDHSSKTLQQTTALLQAHQLVRQYYNHKVFVILHDNHQHESHKTYGPPTSVT